MLEGESISHDEVLYLQCAALTLRRMGEIYEQIQDVANNESLTPERRELIQVRMMALTLHSPPFQFMAAWSEAIAKKHPRTSLEK